MLGVDGVEWLLRKSGLKRLSRNLIQVEIFSIESGDIVIREPVNAKFSACCDSSAVEDFEGSKVMIIIHNSHHFVVIKEHWQISYLDEVS